MSHAHLYTSQSAQAHYRAGRLAALRGEPMTADPHGIGSYASRAWRDGFKDADHTILIRKLNDDFRTSMGTLVRGRVQLTPGVAGEPWTAHVVTAVALTQDFGDDPHGEHDFGALDGVPGCPERVLWKIDYYAPGMEHGSDNPADTAQTVRVLTIMLASEY